MQIRVLTRFLWVVYKKEDEDRSGGEEGFGDLVHVMIALDCVVWKEEGQEGGGEGRGCKSGF